MKSLLNTVICLLLYVPICTTMFKMQQSISISHKKWHLEDHSFFIEFCTENQVTHLKEICADFDLFCRYFSPVIYSVDQSLLYLKISLFITVYKSVEQVSIGKYVKYMNPSYY